jgi:hypothetical protein
VDNDVLLGDVKQLINHTLLSEYDIITPHFEENTLGMFSIFRNTPSVNEIFRLTKRPEGIFNSIIPRAFDEWGGPTEGFYLPYDSTMSGIVHLYHEQLGLRPYKGIEHGHDGYCFFNWNHTCCECHLSQLPNGRQRLEQVCPSDNTRLETLVCHFQYTRRGWKKHCRQMTVDSKKYWHSRANFASISRAKLW